MSNKTNEESDDDDDERTSRQTTDGQSQQSSPSQSFYASFKIYINRLSGRFNEDSNKASPRSGGSIINSFTHFTHFHHF
jgi:hypothetical protein